MHIKVKLFWKIIFFILAFTMMFFIGDTINVNGLVDLRTFILIIFVIVFEIIFIFIAPTYKITLSPESISVNWEIKIIFYTIYEFSKTIPVKEITGVGSFLPYWFPFHFVFVFANGKIFWFGVYLTKKKETFYYLSKIINPDVMDKESREIFKKYKQKYEKKVRT